MRDAMAPPCNGMSFASRTSFAYGRPHMRLAVVSTVVAVLVVLAASTPAFAHQTSVKPVEIEVDGATARISLKAGNGDVAEALALPADAAPDPHQIAAGSARIAEHVAAWAAVAADGAPCPAAAARAASDPGDARFVDIHWEATCPHVIRTLTLDFGALFALDPTQSVMLRLTAPDAVPLDTIIGAAQSPFTVTLGEAGGLLSFVRHGIEHILYGYDHVAFVLALLLVVILARGPRGWEPRHLGSALRATAAIVTSFTVAHSLTLIAASLGWLALPSRLVESLIAVSIVYTAIENIVRPDVRWRFALTFAFGLMHGLGFAGVLAELLPPDDVVVPLLAFNAGVELGQLSIVVVTLPLLALLCRAVSAQRYRRVVMPIASGAIAVLGALWLVERVLDVTILGF
jgi:hypothetical protein